MQSLGREHSEKKFHNLTCKAFLQTGGALALAIIGRQFEMTQKLVKLGFDVNKPCEKVLRRL